MKKILVLSIMVTFMGACAHHGSHSMQGGESCAAGCKDTKCASCKDSQSTKDKKGECEDCKKGG